MALARWTRMIRPDFVMDAVAHLRPDHIRELAPQVEALCFDIDGTVTDYHAPAVPADAAALLRELSQAGYATFVVSNCYGQRAADVHRLYEPLVTGVFTPEDCLDPTRPDDNPGAHAKPAPDMILAAATGAGVPAHQVLMVGDQMFKDVLSARRAGAASLLVPRLGPSDHQGVRWLQRPIERVLRPVLGLPGRRAAWPERFTPVV